MRRVLLFDDEKYMREELKAILSQRKKEYLVQGEYSNCQRVVEKVQELKPDLVLMDIRMDGENEGLQGLDLIKSKFPNVKVLMLTVEDENKKIMQAVRSKADGYMLKDELPFNLFNALDIIFSGGLYMGGKVARKVGESLVDEAAQNKQLLEGLTTAEQDVVDSLMKGNHEYKQIATDLSKSAETVRAQFKNIYRKTGIKSKIELIAALLRRQKKG